MRLLIEIDEADRDVIRATKDVGGFMTLIGPVGRACRARVIARADPTSVTGTGSRGTAIYDIILLDDL